MLNRNAQPQGFNNQTRLDPSLPFYLAIQVAALKKRMAKLERKYVRSINRARELDNRDPERVKKYGTLRAGTIERDRLLRAAANTDAKIKHLLGLAQ